MKRILALILALFMVVGTFVACDSGDTDEVEKPTEKQTEKSTEKETQKQTESETEPETEPETVEMSSLRVKSRFKSPQEVTLTREDADELLSLIPSGGWKHGITKSFYHYIFSCNLKFFSSFTLILSFH